VGQALPLAAERLDQTTQSRKFRVALRHQLTQSRHLPLTNRQLIGQLLAIALEFFTLSIDGVEQPAAQRGDFCGFLTLTLHPRLGLGHPIRQGFRAVP
jgi:hypothetical protein